MTARYFRTYYNGIYAINVTNGDIVWHYIDPDPYNEVPYASNIAGTEPNNLNLTAGEIYSSFEFGSTGATGGGTALTLSSTVLTLSTAQHSTTGTGDLTAINVTTGQQLFKIMGDYGPGAIADGVLVDTDL